MSQSCPFVLLLNQSLSVTTLSILEWQVSTVLEELVKQFAAAFPLTTPLDCIHCEVGSIYMSEVLDTDRDIFKKLLTVRTALSASPLLAGYLGLLVYNMIEIVFCGKRVEKC